jgi:hypothetical protein
MEKVTMIIKPGIGARIFAGTAGTALLLLAFVGLGVPFPGLVFTCLGGPFAIFAFGYVLGTAQTRVDSQGISQCNFFFRSKKLLWNEIESAGIASEEYRDQQSTASWIEYRTRTVMNFKANGTLIRINANSAGPENWWDQLRQIAKERLGDRFDR